MCPIIHKICESVYYLKINHLQANNQKTAQKSVNLQMRYKRMK